jgi:precorrin-4/cobalt-precorrin-4 C11-methyltransferase
MPEAEQLAAFARTGATLAIHLAVQSIDTIVAELLPILGPDCPVAAIYHATWPDQRIIRGSLADIGAKLAAANLERTALILVGRALAAEEFRDSAVYDPEYKRRYRERSPT